jgi:hypothetical protein
VEDPVYPFQQGWQDNFYQITLDELKHVPRAWPFQVMLFEGAIIVIDERVDATDFMPIGEQALSQMRTHKASDTGYETSHDFSSVFFLLSYNLVIGT